jgi:hypothetical protein
MVTIRASVPQPNSLPRFTRRMAWLATALSLAALLSVPSLAAAAGRTFEATGTFIQTSFEVSNVRSAGGVVLFDFTETDILLGTFNGTDEVRGSCAVQASGAGVCHAIETFTGTFDGTAGELQLADVFFLDPSGSFRGPYTIIGGTGGLANLRGHGTFDGTTTGTYEGRLVFAP